MINTKSNSYNSSPLDCNKENVCPNPRFTTALIPSKGSEKRQEYSSMRTDPQFNMFGTINIQRRSNPNSAGTKSRAEMEAILQNFSTKSESRGRISEYSHKSFLALLGLALGKDEISVNEAIERCEEYEITGRQQLLSLMQQKQPTRQWPLPLSNLLLTDLGQLKVTKLCQSISKQQDLDDRELQILQFLVPDIQKLPVLEGTSVMECYNEFRSKIDERSVFVDQLVRAYTLNVHPKISKIKDKVALIKMQKKIRRCDKQNNGVITFAELQNCMDIFKLSQQEMLIAFRYFYFLENEKVVSLVDRKLAVRCSTCYSQLLQKDEKSFIKQTVSTIQAYEQENSTAINGLLGDKNYLLEVIEQQKQEMQRLKKQTIFLGAEIQSKQKQLRWQKQQEIANMKKRFEVRIQALQKENESKDKLIRWYKNELEALVDQSKREFVLRSRQEAFYKAMKFGSQGKIEDNQSQLSCSSLLDQQFQQ